MEDSRHRPKWLFVRVAFYLLVVVVVIVLRGPAFRTTGGGAGFRFPTESDTVKTITLSGVELAPELVPRLISDYTWSFPQLHIIPVEGGTARALEALANHRASVGLMYRPPNREERDIMLSAVKDSVLYFPIALGGIEVLAHDGTGVDSLDANDLRRALRGEKIAAFDTVYAPDPNQGLWDALRSCLGFSASAPVPDTVTFLKDEKEVVDAVIADPRGIGIASTLSLPDTVVTTGVHAVAIRADKGGAAAMPEYERIGYGDYPLFHYLYAACLANGSVRGAMFVTHLTSDRGQRQIERAGFLPARQTARAIVITRHPPGDNRSKEDE
jgi:ABC-type phosphate transport system substrate-binding protein